MDDRDIIHVKLKMRGVNDKGVAFKKGIKFKITKKWLVYLAEGQECPLVGFSSGLPATVESESR